MSFVRPGRVCFLVLTAPYDVNGLPEFNAMRMRKNYEKELKHGASTGCIDAKVHALWVGIRSEWVIDTQLQEGKHVQVTNTVQAAPRIGFRLLSDRVQITSAIKEVTSQFQENTGRNLRVSAKLYSERLYRGGWDNKFLILNKTYKTNKLIAPMSALFCINLKNNTNVTI